MAVIKYSGIVSQLIGKFDGAVYQKCGNSLSIRANPQHRVTRSYYGQAARRDMSTLASLWQSLNVMEQQEFSAVASSYPTVDKFGNPVVLSAYQIFVYINKPLLIAGYPAITSPSLYTPPTLTGAFFNSSDIAIDFFELTADHPLQANHCYMVYISRRLPNSTLRNSYPSYFVLTTTASLNDGVNIFSSIQSRLRSPISTSIYLLY